MVKTAIQCFQDSLQYCKSALSVTYRMLPGEDDEIVISHLDSSSPERSPILPQEFQEDQFSCSDELQDVFYVDSRKLTEKRCFWTALVHDTHRKRGVGPDCVHDSWVDFSRIQRSFR